MASYRSAFVLISAVWFLQLAGGILGIVTPLGLQEMGIDSLGIGLIAALHAGGFMAGAVYAPRLITRIGNIRSFSAAAAVTSIGALAFALVPEAAGWAIIRLVQGASFALMFAAIEAWLGSAVGPEERGGVLGVYNVAAKAALFVGPLLISQYAPLDAENFLFAGLFLAAALVPVCITRQREPAHPALEPLAFPALFRLAPAAVFGVFMAGLVNTGTLALLPVFAQLLGPAEEATHYAVLAYAAANIGGLIFQWPLGWLSDRIDRRTVVAGAALFSALMSGLVFVLAGGVNLTLILVLLAGWGAGSLTFYGLCVAHGVDRAAPHQMTQLMSGLLFVWAFGSVIGPVLLGFAMQTGLGPRGLFLVSGLLLFALSVVMLVRRASVAGPEDAAQEEWKPATPRSVIGAELDPRIEEAD